MTLGLPRPTIRAWLQRFALVAIFVTAAVGCGSDSDSLPDCMRRGLADGTLYREEPGPVLALARMIEVSNPNLSELINATAAYHKEHPDLESLDLEKGGGPNTVLYAAVLLALADRPDLATPEVLDALVDQANDGGISGVASLVANSDLYPSGQYGGQALIDLRAIAFDIEDGVLAAGLFSAPSPHCNFVDD